MTTIHYQHRAPGTERWVTISPKPKSIVALELGKRPIGETWTDEVGNSYRRLERAS